jgi:peptidoglycan/LPS O-acetylase OafA/YrhL
MTTGHNNVRVDIQVLRGLAVMLVVVFHTKLGLLRMGYLGVDIFFVISGYLITSIVAKGLVAGTFSFREFYFRRAKRLLPAAYATFFLTLIASPFLLTDLEMHDFVQQLFGALAFCANIVLWTQTGYFTGLSDIKPLLHVWSLSIEEQYYFLMPLLLFLAPARWRLTAVLVPLVVSFAYCFTINEKDAAMAFYLLPSRAWEMAIGSVGALITVERRLATFLHVLFWPALACLLVIPFIHISGPHPGYAALAVCIATMIVIMRRHPGWEGRKWLAPAVWAGNVSYSLYLVHWPIIAFFNNAWIQDNTFNVPNVWKVAQLVASLALAWVIYTVVEVPTRRAKLTFSWPRAAMAASISLIFALGASFTSALSKGDVDYSALRAHNHGLNRVCALTGNRYNPAACQTSAAPTTLVWGDSFAMHLVPGLQGNDITSIAQATKSLCGPTLGTALIPKGRSASQCIDFNDSVLRFLKATPSIETVILSANMRNYFFPHTKLRVRIRQGLRKNFDSNVDYVYKAFVKTVLAVRQTGRKVVIISPPPTAEYDIARCMERADRGLPILSHESSCIFPASVFRKRNTKLFELYEKLEKHANVNVIRLDLALCDDTICQTRIEGVPIFRDYGHLSRVGSVALLSRLKIAQKINQLAK